VTLATGALRIALISAPHERWVGTRSEKELAPSFPSLTVPHLAGFLAAHGHLDLRHYDLDLVFSHFRERSEGDLSLPFLDPGADGVSFVPRSPELDRFADRLVRTAQVTPADLFGLSMSLLDLDNPRGQMGFELMLGLAPALKRLFPRCRIALGGFTGRSQERIHGLAGAAAERYPELDWVVEGFGEQPLLQILDAVAAERRAAKPASPPTADRVIRPSSPVADESPSPRLVEPVFQTIEQRRTSGACLADRYSLGAQARQTLKGALGQSTMPLIFRFMEGCRGGCAFCGLCGTAVHARPVKDVVRALGRLSEKHDSRSFVLMNSCLNWSREYALDFARELRAARLGLLWTDSLDFAHLDEPLIAALRESGLIRVDLGAETGSDRLLRFHSKSTSRARMQERLRWLHQHGIWNHLNFITGLPSETQADVDETLAFITESAEQIDNCTVNRFWVVEHSQVRRTPERFGLTLGAAPIATEDGYRLPYSGHGLSFEQAMARAGDAQAAIVSAIERLKGLAPQRTVHYHLLFWLYGALGHDRKREIVRIHTDALTPREPAVAVRAAAALAAASTGPVAPPTVAPLEPLLDRVSQRLSVDARDLPPGTEVVRAEPHEDGLKVTVRRGELVLAFGVTLTRHGRPAMVRGPVLSVSVQRESGEVPHAFVAAFCRALEKLAADGTPTS